MLTIRESLEAQFSRYAENKIVEIWPQIAVRDKRKLYKCATIRPYVNYSILEKIPFIKKCMIAFETYHIERVNWIYKFRICEIWEKFNQVYKK